MAIKYRGSGTLSEVEVFLYGDGTSKSIDINLAKAPFCLEFKGNTPVIAYVVSEESSYPPEGDVTSVSMYAGTPPSEAHLVIEFSQPLPELIQWDTTEVGGPGGAAKVTIRFIYQKSAAKRKKRRY